MAIRGSTEENSLYICGGAFRDLEESLTTVYRIDLLLGRGEEKLLWLQVATQICVYIVFVDFLFSRLDCLGHTSDWGFTILLLTTTPESNFQQEISVCRGLGVVTGVICWIAIGLMLAGFSQNQEPIN